jgi:acylphosphatase
MIKRIKVKVEGRVQGVGFRYFAQRKAELLHLQGFIRNLPDGGVETIAEGEEAALKEYLERLRSGPQLAQVAQIEVEWLEADASFRGFQVRH